MRRPGPRPLRSVRSELLFLASAVAVPAALVYSFPGEAVGFVPASDPAAGAASCAFVTLSEEQVEAATERAHAAWRVGATGVRRLRTDIYAMDLPEGDRVPATDVSDRLRPPPPGPVRYDEPPMPPTLAAPPPARIAAPETDRDGALPFPRRELLSIDHKGTIGQKGTGK